MTSGVPQRSVLEPVLFLIYINDLDVGINCGIKKFADDTKIYGKVNDANGISTMQSNLDTLMAWSIKWGMEFNVGKCKCMQLGKHRGVDENNKYRMSGMELEITKEEWDLGVITTDNFKSAQQCSTAVKKANRILGMIWRVIKKKSPEVLLPLYKGLVRPHLEYAVQAWSPSLIKDRELMERVQHRFTRMTPGMAELEYSNRLKQLGLPSLMCRRERGDLIETFKILKGFERVDRDKFFRVSHNITTRGHNLKLVKAKCSKNVRKNCFSYRMVNRWNKLDKEIVENSTSINMFKNRLDGYLLKTGALYES